MKVALVLTGVVAAVLLVATLTLGLIVPDDCFVSFSGTRPECTSGDIGLLVLYAILWVLFGLLVAVSAALAIWRLVRGRRTV